MDTDRPFICNDCKKTFKLTWHLKTHMKTCKGIKNEISLACDNCDSRFSSKRTLAFHGKTCLPGKCYRCDDCNTKFVLYKQFYDHKRKFHTSLKCDYCEVTISNDKNMKRHVKLKQRGLTPSRARSLEMRKPPTTEKRFECDECKKTFHDKSTLNRHKKIHTFVCKTCEKVFLSKEDLNKHKKSHSGKTRILKLKKNVIWANVLEQVREIPTTKLAFNAGTSASIKQMFSSIESFLPLFANRNRSLNINEFKVAYENISKKSLDDLVFRALLSIYPEAYKVERPGNVLNVILNGKSKPSDLTECFDERMKELDVTNPRYIDLIEFEERKETIYKSAKETIVENIVKFVDDDDNGDIDLFLEVLELNNKFKTGFERLKNIIEIKSMKKKKRESKIKNIDWQLLRLERLARLVNKIFLSEKKTALRLEFLEEKLIHSEYSCTTVKSDLERLIKNSNGWLKIWKGWIKKNSSMDVTNVVKLF